MPQLKYMLDWILSRVYSLEFHETSSIVLQSAFKLQIPPFQTSFPLLHYFLCSKHSGVLYIDYYHTCTMIRHKGPAFWWSDSLGWVALFRGNSLAGGISPFWTPGEIIVWVCCIYSESSELCAFYELLIIQMWWHLGTIIIDKIGDLGLPRVILHDLP